MLIKANKELTQLIVIHNGNKHKFSLSLSYVLRPATDTPTFSDLLIGKQAADILSDTSIPVGAFIGRDEKTTNTDYDLIAQKSSRSTVAEVEDYIKDFTDSEREIILSKLFKITK